MNQNTPASTNDTTLRTMPAIRRSLAPRFLRLAGAGLGSVGTLATVGLSASALAADAKPGPNDIPSIRLADAFKTSLAEAPGTVSFEGAGMTGAEVLARYPSENLAALFCAPGNYTIINALAAAGIPAYGGRTEGSMCAMADGFSACHRRSRRHVRAPKARASRT